MLAAMLLAIRNVDWHATTNDVALIAAVIVLMVVYIMLKETR